MKLSEKWWYFTAFAACFAVLAAYVFWDTWSPDVAPVMPDDAWTHPLAFSDQFAGWWRGWLGNGILTPISLFSDPILVSKYWTQELKIQGAIAPLDLMLDVYLCFHALSPKMAIEDLKAR